MTRTPHRLVVALAMMLCLGSLPSDHVALAQSSLDQCPDGDSAAWDNCFGKWSDGEGYTYEGEWHDNQQNGEGTATYAGGERYVGEFKNGAREGEGRWTSPDGSRYVGEFKNDHFDGAGTWTSKDGERYVGEFKNDQYEGQGTLTTPDGETYVGDFKNDVFDGLGTYSFNNGDRFEGQYKQGEPSGHGAYIWADGRKSVGDFRGYKLNGHAVNYASDGSVVEQGLFEDDVLKTPDSVRLNTDTQNNAATDAAQPSMATENVAGSHHKVALIIGNGAYENAPQLTNPRNDATAMSRMLNELGFTVISAFDANKRDMENSIREFLREAKSADLSLFFYSGHGIEVGGENFLLPIDTKLEDEAALNFEVINSKVITDAMGGDKQVGVILLDACRSNPFSRSLKRSLVASRAASVSDGLAPISASGGGLVVAFATAPGDTASDGSGRNSPFTTALLKWMPEKGLEIEQVMKRVKSDVSASTGNDQRPWTNSDLTKDVYLAGQ